ncbi:septum formation initiator family protein [Corynebacterium liangguodongii]|uniref:Septum formation initiator n=1 Tax=Corynebacterium liangguodongii TaxID=2079535 RepID=A0A2S0WF90_9CORY|nr:septum formation initiator family protein [Corynebacterium liangguodongii]AWB84441.1 septum formation initiator [Corynebacterium liangguodongii]PWB99930.1 septum formation initiator family protein [Corynebacterium liangguodongii]
MSTPATPPGKPESTPRRPRATTVPVASREREKAERNRSQQKAAKRQASPQELTSTVILILVILAVLLAIAVPLRNYYEGRSEIARLNDSIAALEQRKSDLEGDIAKYQDPEYIKQEARRRLGVLEPGETAWRIIDPRMTQGEGITTQAAPDERSWVQVMWDSLREVPGEERAPE